MKKLLDYDWSRAVHLLCNSVQNCVISCNYNLKANKSIKMQVLYDNDEGMSNFLCTHELSPFHRHFSYIRLTSNQTFYEFNMELICACVF